MLKENARKIKILVVLIVITTIVLVVNVNQSKITHYLLQKKFNKNIASAEVMLFDQSSNSLIRENVKTGEINKIVDLPKLDQNINQVKYWARENKLLIIPAHTTDQNIESKLLSYDLDTKELKTLVSVSSKVGPNGIFYDKINDVSKISKDRNIIMFMITGYENCEDKIYDIKKNKTISLSWCNQNSFSPDSKEVVTFSVPGFDSGPGFSFNQVSNLFANINQYGRVDWTKISGEVNWNEVTGDKMDLFESPSLDEPVRFNGVDYAYYINDNELYLFKVNYDLQVVYIFKYNKSSKVITRVAVVSTYELKTHYPLFFEDQNLLLFRTKNNEAQIYNIETADTKTYEIPEGIFNDEFETAINDLVIDNNFVYFVIKKYSDQEGLNDLGETNSQIYILDRETGLGNYIPSMSKDYLFVETL